MGMAMAKQIGEAMAGSAAAPPAAATPPPIPREKTFHVAEGGQPTGPFALSELKRRIEAGELTRASLVWTQGMSAWASAESVAEIAHLFGATPPPIPPAE
jgi:hypothetical protein